MKRDLLKEQDVSITVFQGMEGLESLRDTWNEIVSGMTRRHFFHLWEWHYSYLKCLEPDPRSFMYFLFMKEKTPVAIFPLHVTKTSIGGLQLKTLASPSHKHMVLGDIICKKDALHLPLFNILSGYLRNQKKSWDLIQLFRLLEDAGAIQVIQAHPPSMFLLTHDLRCDFIDTGGDYESLVSGLSKNFRRSLKRAKQHLDQLPKVELTITHNGPALAEKLDTFMDVEASGWKGSLGSGTAIKLHANLKCFYRTLTSTLFACGKVSINTLTVHGQCIAAQYCILLDNTAYILKIGYDEDYKRCAPGNMLLELFMKKSIEDRTINTINLITDAEWHADWKPGSYEKHTLYIFNATPAGLLGFVILKAHPILKKYYEAYIQPHLPRGIQEKIGRLSRET